MTVKTCKLNQHTIMVMPEDTDTARQAKTLIVNTNGLPECRPDRPTSQPTNQQDSRENVHVHVHFIHPSSLP